MVLTASEAISAVTRMSCSSRQFRSAMTFAVDKGWFSGWRSWITICHAMGSSSEDDAAVDSDADSPGDFVAKVSKNQFRLLLSDDDDCLDWSVSKQDAVESINADKSPGSGQSGGDLLNFVDSKFGEVLPLVLEHAVLQDFSMMMFSKSRSWAVRQPSAKKVFKQVLVDRELRTPVKVSETLAKLVHFAVALIRVGVSSERPAVELAENHGVEKLFQDFHLFDYEVVVAAALSLSEAVLKKQFQFAASVLAGVSSGLCLVCSGLQSDIKTLAATDELMTSARKLGMPKRLTLRECISRASESVMFGEPSYWFDKKLIRSGTELDRVSSEPMPFWGAGSTEPRQ